MVFIENVPQQSLMEIIMGGTVSPIKHPKVLGRFMGTEKNGYQKPQSGHKYGLTTTEPPSTRSALSGDRVLNNE